MKTLSIFALLTLGFTAPAFANSGEEAADQVRKGGKKPPKEMHDAMKHACEGKAVGDSCTVKTPARGDVEAKCEEAKGPEAGTLICALPLPKENKSLALQNFDGQATRFSLKSLVLLTITIVMENSNPFGEDTEYRDPTLEYTLISIESVATGISDEFDVYMKTGGGFFLVKPKNAPIANHVVAGLKRKNPYLYLRQTDRESYFQKLNKSLESSLKNDYITPSEKASLLTDYAVEIVEKLFSDPGNPQTIQNAKSVSNFCASFVGSHRHAFLHLVELSSHDQYTYAHSIGVASYALALGQEMGFRKEELSDLGLAGLLHDIGKCKVDTQIINKKAPLSADEWKIMKKHPEYGTEILQRHKVSPVIVLAAGAHHENMLGTGYPKGLLAQKLDPAVSIVCLADAFSALTTRRSYSKARDSMSALMLMKDNLGTKFDSNLFKRFVTLFLDTSKKAA